MWEWLASPIDPSRLHAVGFHVAWHGRLMVLAWGVLVPTGILSARYLKIWPGQNWPDQLDNQRWWIIHQACQYCAGVLMLGATWLILMRPDRVFSLNSHALFGWGILCLAGLQIAGGLLRGSKGGPTELAAGRTLQGDHYDMTRRRLIFEYAHKTFGYLALVLSVFAILLGLWEANGPIWMWIALPSWWAGLITVFVLMQRRGMTADTYEAIWGPNPEHPGNHRAPIGVGVKRTGRRARKDKGYKA